jgi:hypothetical protein
VNAASLPIEIKRLGFNCYLALFCHRAFFAEASVPTLSEPRRERDPAHLKRVASRPCLVCGRNRAQAHHLTYLQPRAMGRKVSDEFTVPLCSIHHRELRSSGNEKGWWVEQGIDPEPVAKALWKERRQPTAGRKPMDDLCAPPQAKTEEGSQ